MNAIFVIFIENTKASNWCIFHERLIFYRFLTLIGIYFQIENRNIFSLHECSDRNWQRYFQNLQISIDETNKECFKWVECQKHYFWNNVTSFLVFLNDFYPFNFFETVFQFTHVLKILASSFDWKTSQVETWYCLSLVARAHTLREVYKSVFALRFLV